MIFVVLHERRNGKLGLWPFRRNLIKNFGNHPHLKTWKNLRERERERERERRVCVLSQISRSPGPRAQLAKLRIGKGERSI